MHGVRALTRDRVDEAAGTLAAAFADDPVFRWMSRDRDRFAERLPHAFRSMIRVELRAAGAPLFISDDGRSVALWHEVDRWKASPLNSLRVVPGFIRGFGWRADRLLKVQSILEAAHPHEPHVHLSFVGTRPDAQGAGLGAKVLRPMIERCDREGVAAYLESSHPRNESFYFRQGFVATGTFDLPSGAPPMTAMWRDPR